MQLSDAGRRVVFGAIVVVLAGVGIALTVPGFGDGGDGDGDGATSSPSPSATPSAVTATPSGTSSASASPSPRPSGTFDIYRLLPFDRGQFVAASGVAQRFVVAYGTYRYDEPSGAYLSRLKKLATADLAGKLADNSGGSAGGQDLKKHKTVSTATATVDSIRAFGPSSLIFVVSGTQHVTGDGGPTSHTTKYAVTVVHGSGDWRVQGFDPASAGNS